MLKIAVPACGRCGALKGHIVGETYQGTRDCHHSYREGEFCCHHCGHIEPPVPAMCDYCKAEITPDGKCGCKGIGRAMNFTPAIENDPDERAAIFFGLANEHNPDGDKYY